MTESFSMSLDDSTPFDDHPHEECGIFGAYVPGREAARLAFFALYALQHRGQESAGIATSDGIAAYSHKGMGLVNQVFNEDNLRPLHGHLAIAHNRYSTTGSSHMRNASPYLIESAYGPLGVAHNGNLTNTAALRERLLHRGAGLNSTTDSEVVTLMLAAPPQVWTGVDPDVSSEQLDLWQQRIRAFMQLADGAYSLTILTRDAVYGVRDPHGLRPLCLGEMSDGGHVLASETTALHTIGAAFVREVQPGEIVKLDASGLTSVTGCAPRQRALCSFEYVYFARPDSRLEGQIVHGVRQRLGRQLAIEQPADADIVIGVPDSAVPAAIGYAAQIGLPYTEGLTKNRYIGRTFIQPDQQLRRDTVRLKYTPLVDNLAGKRVVLVDDSIVRGTTSGPLVALIRDGGASEVHVRVSSPPVRHPCFMGVDMATKSQLIAHRFDERRICAEIGADSLGYLSLEGMLDAINEGADQPSGHCAACFSGRYPITIPAWLFDEDRTPQTAYGQGIWAE
ncbi:MAG: amidophosphoribosyltransferase [Anaerolineae bacterium]|jgi:amidophosphoribosyltransferase|nr:amidophosphoribosyltransferase [Chloroflexota bacterium]MBV6436379.1 Amidophosphoribosyltransferase [Anaerolineae bacterium]MCO6444735.1 amidophosphoribosyltransferase [Anaerolineae bacterium]OQY83611.1 MAG: amidophosphoribosyltransferase [Anaerolineae bacterium UTCFX5]GIK26995.1 MAG: amidophosphoribosyltransferase [Chloroflexota bacterium]